MENFVDIFGNDLFSTTSLTEAINIVPNMYGRINEQGLFRFEGVNTTSVVIELEDGVLNLLSTQARNTPPQASSTGKRRAISLEIPHIPANDFIYPTDVQGVRMFGSASQMDTVENVTNKKLTALAQKHHITWEWHRVGAISGLVLDADGSVLLDLFEKFGVQQKTVYFDFQNAQTNVEQKSHEVVAYMEDNLLGEVMDGIHAYCSPGYMDWLLAHKEVQEAYRYYASAQEPNRKDVRRRFEYRGIVYEEYRGQATYRQQDGTIVTRKFIPDDEARFVPTGTRQAFLQYGAPANFLETVNTIGVPMYAKVMPDPNGRHVEVYAESNPLFLCTRPNLLVRGVRGADPG